MHIKKATVVVLCVEFFSIYPVFQRKLNFTNFHSNKNRLLEPLRACRWVYF